MNTPDLCPIDDEFARRGALVTGGARGIGTAVAQRLLDSGKTVLSGPLEDRSAVVGVIEQIEALGFGLPSSDSLGRARNRLNLAMTTH